MSFRVEPVALQVNLDKRSARRCDTLAAQVDC